MALVEHDYTIEEIATDGTDQPLNEWILPGRVIGDDDFLDAHMLDPPAEERAVDGVAIADQESRSMILGKRLDGLWRRPLGCWMRSGVEVYDHAAVMAEYDETEQDAKRRCRDCEEVDCHDIANVVVQEGSPRLRRRFVMADLVLVHGSLRCLVAKESEFRLDPWSSPEGFSRDMR